MTFVARATRRHSFLSFSLRLRTRLRLFTENKTENIVENKSAKCCGVQKTIYVVYLNTVYTKYQRHMTKYVHIMY